MGGQIGYREHRFVCAPPGARGEVSGDQGFGLGAGAGAGVFQ